MDLGYGRDFWKWKNDVMINGLQSGDMTKIESTIYWRRNRRTRLTLTRKFYFFKVQRLWNSRTAQCMNSKRAKIMPNRTTALSSSLGRVWWNIPFFCKGWFRTSQFFRGFLPHSAFQAERSWPDSASGLTECNQSLVVAPGLRPRLQGADVGRDK